LRIACIGGESTGKSTLAQALAAAVHGIVVTEALRAFVEEHGRTPLREEQRSILLAQRLREEHAANQHPHAHVICDPATLMTAVYSQMYFDDDSLHDDAAVFARDYDALLWCRPDIPWVAEPGLHDGPQFRDQADALLAAWVNELAPGGCVLEITGAHGRIPLAHQLLKAEFGSVWQPEAAGQST